MTERAKPPTLADVARLADVSVPAASRALNGGVRGMKSGSPEMRARVEQAALTLGYSVNPAAQTIKGGRARTAAFIVADIDDFGSATMIAGVMHAAEDHGMSVAVRTTKDDPQRELQILAQLRGERHRAIIMATSRTTDPAREAAVGEQLQILADHGAHIVIIGDNELGFPTVTVDNHRAARLLAEGLARAGRRRFAVISGPAVEITARDRVQGFVEGLAEYDIHVDERDIIHTEFSRNGGYQAVSEIADRLGEFDVITAMSDAMAVGAIARLRELDLTVPRDMEVTGFDHVPMLGDVLQSFSTVEVPLERFGAEALALALAEEPTKVLISLEATPIVHGEPARLL
ncbi:HTH-type transcriptional repressor CytR [Microbacterium sp. Bi98]|uniref:LacI family DNA-binding transcriptional regulator n=1 Tax=Microbacterium sp. Bi98 TaxID=2821116 RepID=UPI001D1CAED9|nr:LacI family DNA-binding transcriptional regulator [Microbacterium sp. Bi98]CAH0148923.1 HTH-type transcriptional repressor CytR [Microbacterium sp. Bi98]